ncbi:MAG: hypothetical protein ABSF33_20195, partial [Acidimicrobiales bacterium]
MSIFRRALVLSAMVVMALGASLILEAPTAAPSTYSAQQVEGAQSGQGPSSLRICFATQKCVPANHPSNSGTVSPALAYGFIGVTAMVLADRRRRRRGPAWHPSPFKFFPAIFRPPIASEST